VKALGSEGGLRADEDQVRAWFGASAPRLRKQARVLTVTGSSARVAQGRLSRRTPHFGAVGTSASVEEREPGDR